MRVKIQYVLAELRLGVALMLR